MIDDSSRVLSIYRERRTTSAKAASTLKHRANSDRKISANLNITVVQVEMQPGSHHGMNLVGTVDATWTRLGRDREIKYMDM